MFTALLDPPWNDGGRIGEGATCIVQAVSGCIVKFDLPARVVVERGIVPKAKVSNTCRTSNGDGGGIGEAAI